MTTDRRTIDRRISPAIGQYAIGEAHRLRELNNELLRALEMVASVYQSENAVDYVHGIARAAIAKAQQ